MPSLAQSSTTTKMNPFLLLASHSSMGSSERSTFSVVSSPIIKGTGSTKFSRPVGPTPSVRFHPEADTVHEVWSRSDLSPDDRSQLWFSLDDLKKIKSGIRTTARMIRSGRFEEDYDNFCARGIVSDAGKTERRERLAQQLMELFWCNSLDYFSTPDTSLRLQELSRSAAEEAILRAKQDRQDALKVYRKVCVI